MTDDDICQVDLYVKSRLVKDVINLAKKKRDSLADISEFGCLTQIHPDGDYEAAVDMFDLVTKLRTIFYSLCKRNDKTGITSQQFERLYNKNVIKNSGVQKIDLTLAF